MVIFGPSVFYLLGATVKNVRPSGFYFGSMGKPLIIYIAKPLFCRYSAIPHNAMIACSEILTLPWDNSVHRMADKTDVDRVGVAQLC